MRIGTIAKVCGVSNRLMRYYEAQGLIKPHRDSNGYRYYDTSHVRQVQEIRQMLAAGFSTREIQDFVPCFSGEHHAGPCEEGLKKHMGKLREIEGAMESLERRKEFLLNRLERFHLSPQQIHNLVEGENSYEDKGANSHPGIGNLLDRRR